MTDPAVTDVTAENVAKTGFFCFMSKKKEPGYQRKLAWLRDRFAEGMRIRMLEKPERGFIEYIPGEHTWRALHADGYLVVHCLWVVGTSKGKGLGHALVELCEEDARASGCHGVVMLTSESVWLMGKALLGSRGYECVEEADPSFSLMVKRFGDAPPPRLAGDWDGKAARLGDGLTVLHTPQCPYVPDAVRIALETAQGAGVPAREIELASRDDVLARCPNPYGVFGMALNGKPLSYHYLMAKDLLPLLTEARDP